VGILEKRAASDPNLEYIIIDTPGQIESFTWSASGQIITESLATSFPTLLTFVADTPRCADPSTFMSTMLYACSIMYRSAIPLCVAFNKTDVTPHEEIAGWMKDFESFQAAMDRKDEAGGGSGYYESLTRSMALTLDEFYAELQTCGVSAATGEGTEGFFDAADRCREEYFEEFAVDLIKKKEERDAKEKVREEEEVKKMTEALGKDLNVGGKGGGEGA
jgi:GTPase SAR1 family protein